jgi:hypothetical protein
MFDTLRSILTPSETPQSNQIISTKPTESIGAGTGEEAFDQFTKTMNWITDTKKKLPNGSSWEVSPAMREEAFNIDPLVSGIIMPFLKNTILADYSIITKNNKKYINMTNEIDIFIEEIELMDASRDDFEDYAIKQGHSYRRKDYEGDELDRLQRLEPRAMKVYEDIWDSSIVAYHQQIEAANLWVEDASTTEYNSWFIPDGLKYIPGVIEDNGAKKIWDETVKKYGITDTENLRVDGADKIIAMHRVKIGTPAPMDRAILAIWLKRLILANGPNFIFSVLFPFLHIKNGVLSETTIDGIKQFISTVPESPPAGLATTDPEKYAAMNAAYDTYVEAAKEDANNIVRYRTEGGVLASGPDKELKVVESGRSISPAFIKTMMDLLNEDIGQSFGFPVSLIMARGAELATTRTISELFNNAYAGARRDYHKIADELIRERFENDSWDYEIINKDGTTEKGKFTFEEAAPHFLLDTGDVTDALKIAQTDLTNMQMLEVAKKVGASRADIQMLADERDITNLDLEKFDEVGGAGMFGMKSTIEEEDEPEISPEEDKLTKELIGAYHTAKESITTLLE